MGRLNYQGAFSALEIHTLHLWGARPSTHFNTVVALQRLLRGFFNAAQNRQHAAGDRHRFVPGSWAGGQTSTRARPKGFNRQRRFWPLPVSLCHTSHPFTPFKIEPRP